MLHSTVSHFGLNDIRYLHLDVLENDLKYAEPLAARKVAQRASVKNVYLGLLAHDVTAQISASATGGWSGSAASSKVPSSNPRARSTVIASRRYNRRTACS